MTLQGYGARVRETGEFKPPAISDACGDARMGEALVALVREGLRQQGRISLRLQGESMWPTIPGGSLVTVERVAPEAIRLGEVVVWHQDGHLIAHRVVQRLGDGATLWLVTKGDNCSTADRRLKLSAILGRVVARHGQDGVVIVRSGWFRKLEVAFWVWRWRLRRVAGVAGRFLPTQVRKPLVRLRDRMGRGLSLAFRLTLLRY